MAKSNYAFTWLGKAEDKEKLHLGLEELTGNDFEAAERAEMTAGNNAPLLMFSKSFQARLAAMALKVPAPEVKALPIKKYAVLTSEVFTFLFGQSEESVLEKPIEG